MSTLEEMTARSPSRKSEPATTEPSRRGEKRVTSSSFRVQSDGGIPAIADTDKIVVAVYDPYISKATRTLPGAPTQDGEASVGDATG
jgi:hypothetical protein